VQLSGARAKSWSGAEGKDRFSDTLLLRLFANAADPIARTATLGTALKAVLNRAFRAA